MNKITLPENITGLSADSRAVKPGFLFAALPGVKFDGRDFIPKAIENGATVILTTGYHDDDVPDNVTVINCENPRHDFALMAAAFYKDQPEHIVAVTGSNGKSSTVSFCRQLWAAMNINGVSLGTIGVEGAGFTGSAGMTTPDPVSLHKTLTELKQAGVTHLAMETSSHGLEQYRSHGVNLTAAGFTNLSRDHLDYHKTMENYLAAKMRLFTEVLPRDGTAVLNADVPEFEQIKSTCDARGIRVLSYGHTAQDIVIQSRDTLPQGQALSLDVCGQTYNIELPLVGEFQTYNALCALGLIIAAGADHSATEYLTQLSGVRGRMELAGTLKNGAAVYVDYAHTPDGLKTVLEALRPHCQNHLHVVFGCGGDRDAGKRPMMGDIAATLADRAIVTDDNPRSEDAATIRRAVIAASEKLIETGGRRNAIEQAIADLEKGDILVIAGKGHEQGQIIGDDTLPFDDVTVAREYIK